MDGRIDTLIESLSQLLQLSANIFPAGNKPIFEKKPAAVSEARFNQPGLYCPKMQKYSELMGYSVDFVEKLKRFNRFQVCYLAFPIQFIP